MNLKPVSFLLCIALLMCCVPALAEDDAITVTDMTGREASFSEPVTRIVAITPADCEILCALGAEESIVGRGEYCDYPESILDIPAVNSGSEINIEQIIALEPQVVVMSTMDHEIEVVNALEGAGIRVVALLSTDIEGIYEAIGILGTLTGKTGEAEALISSMKATFEDIANNSDDEGKTVYFEVSPLEWGLWTAGSGTFMNELAEMCGLTNAFADVEGWAEISEEQVLARNPDYIVTTAVYYGEGATPVEEIMGRAGWESVTAVAEGNIYNADSNEISRPGPRFADAASKFYEFLKAE